jgi:hypothetical protein
MINYELTVAQAAQVLETTADRFETGEYRWGQEAYWDQHTDAVCMVGGINSTRGVPVTSTLPAIIYGAMQPHLGERKAFPPFPYPEGFNDAEGRTKEEVIEVLKLTAKDLRNRAGAQ